ncbi:MAG: hypothetical protein M1366_01120 [Patescibacteria group bacterium]|nr:hypothetical protein [Patescibacteria group bacterium]
MTQPSKKAFRFKDPRQERIYKKLLEIGPGPAAFFKDACRMWEDDPPLESRTHLIAHCLREIESSVRDVMLPLGFKHTPGSKETQKEEIQEILALYGVDPDDEVAKLWVRIANRQEEIALHHMAHRNSLDRPRESGATFDELWTGMHALLDVILNRLEANYLGFIDILEGLLAKTTVSQTDISTLRGKIPTSPVTYNYFFERLDNPNWLTPLKEAGFFKSPPPPMEHPEGGTSYPFWSQGLYLKKMAAIPEKQSEVLEICLDVETENTRARSDLLEIALLLPVEMSVQIVESIEEIDYFLSPEKYGKLIKYFARNGKISEAITLANRVLAIQPDPRPAPEYGGHKIPHDPTSTIRDYDYEEILEKDFPDFVDTAGLEAIKVLLGQYESYIKHSDTDRESGSKDDHSEIWRPAIEDHSQNHKFGIRDVLVTGIRDACERFLARHTDQMGNLLTELESRDLLTFKRLELHLLRLFPTGNEKRITDLLMNEEEFGDRQRLTHEYFLLAETQAFLLSAERRKVLWSWIEKGGEVDMDDYLARCKRNGVEPSDEQVEKYKKNWQMYHLLPFKSIDPTWNEYYEGLMAAVGEPEFPSFRSWSGGSSWGYKSSISDEEFNKMKPDEVAEFLKKWEPPSNGDPLETSREGTSRALTTQISNDPDKWSRSLASFKDLDPTYVRSVFSGHRDALRQKKLFDWKPLLDLCATILTKPIKVKDRKPSGFYADDPDWNWSRNTIAELITEGVDAADGKIPLELKDKLWKIIETLTHDPRPTPEEETKQLESDRDPLMVAINSTRGDAIQAVIRYGIWLKNSVPEDEKKDWSLVKNAPEVLKVLNDHLDTRVDPSLGIRALYGERLGNLCWLDLGWVKANLQKIFPEEQKFFDAAWETFIIFNPAYNDFIPMLLPQYQRAVKEIGKHTDGKHHLENPEQNLAQHLILFYCRGKLPLNKDLLKEFYDVVPLELRAEVIDFIGRSAKDTEMSEDVRAKFVALAEHRLAVIKVSKTPQVDVQEFKDFSWWVYSEKFDGKWSLDLLIEALKLGCDIEGDHLIIERYTTLAPKFPLEVITSTELMVENDKKGWGVPTWGEELGNVIKLVLESKNAAAITKAKEFIHRLVAKGHPQYKDLLPANTETDLK